MRLHEIIEAMQVSGTRIREIRTRQQFLAALKRHHFLRAFVDTDRDIIIGWDADSLVHPDVRRATGDFGIPVQMDGSSISLRPHGMPLAYVKQMYRELVAAPVIKRAYGGVVPRIDVDDEWEAEGDVGNLSQVDKLGWEDGDDDPGDHWTSQWASY